MAIGVVTAVGDGLRSGMKWRRRCCGRLPLAPALFEIRPMLGVCVGIIWQRQTLVCVPRHDPLLHYTT
jgi:hypothetical protein